MALWEVLPLLLLSLLELARCPTSLCTSLCRARTGASPSQRLSDPLSLLLLITLAPPTVSAPTGGGLSVLSPLASLDTDWWDELVTESLEGSAMESVSATVLLVELASVLEECTTATPDTMAPPSSTPLSSVRNVIANSSLSVKEIYLFYLLK